MRKKHGTETAHTLREKCYVDDLLKSVTSEDGAIKLIKCVEQTSIGVSWNVEADTFGFKIAIKEKPLTRRGVLSTLSSIYDLLGHHAPFLLQGKQIIQTLCAQNFRWDNQVTQDIGNAWKK